MFKVDFEGLQSMEDSLQKQISARRSALGRVDDAIHRLRSMGSLEEHASALSRLNNRMEEELAAMIQMFHKTIHIRYLYNKAETEVIQNADGIREVNTRIAVQSMLIVPPTIIPILPPPQLPPVKPVIPWPNDIIGGRDLPGHGIGDGEWPGHELDPGNEIGDGELPGNELDPGYGDITPDRQDDSGFRRVEFPNSKVPHSSADGSADQNRYSIEHETVYEREEMVRSTENIAVEREPSVYESHTPAPAASESTVKPASAVSAKSGSASASAGSGTGASKAASGAAAAAASADKAASAGKSSLLKRLPNKLLGSKASNVNISNMLNRWNAPLGQIPMPKTFM